MAHLWMSGEVGGAQEFLDVVEFLEDAVPRGGHRSIGRGSRRGLGIQTGRSDGDVGGRSGQARRAGIARRGIAGCGGPGGDIGGRRACRCSEAVLPSAEGLGGGEGLRRAQRRQRRVGIRHRIDPRGAGRDRGQIKLSLLGHITVVLFPKR